MSQGNRIGLTSLTALVFSSMVGAGIFSLPQNMAEVAGLNAMIVGWTITGVGILLLAGCFLHLSRLKPDLDGGIYAYAREGFGDLAGFLSAWGYWLCATIGVVGYLVVAFAALGAFVDTPDFTLFGDGTTIYAFICESLVLWSVHSLILRGVTQAAFINLLATLAKSVPLILFVCAAYYFFDTDTFHIDPQGETLQQPFIEQVKGTMLITLWVFTGIEGAVILSGRAKNRKDIGRATYLGVIAALILYVLISLMSLGIASRAEIATISNPSMAGLMAAMTGSWGKAVISIGLIVSVLASYLSWILYSAEVPYTAAKYGAFPKFFAKSNDNDTPKNSLFLTSLTVQLCLILVMLTGEGYNTLVLISTSMILIPYFLVGAYLLKLSIQTNARLQLKLIGFGASIYGIWLVYAAGVDTLLLSAILYIPGIALYVYSRRQHRLNPTST
ncbi:basic amino acid/polyamine antiporter [Vibrio natriegens]|uniref:basic amino acid/polyamine antiporter n=1 Tax=Vibrio natriegens TaxID=691 RepID=UPI00080462D8|nr:basic amino acid/polyamine antiporter [Vibrio natriegens]ANQ29041.1 arginine:ornithine antiporter [Vibrio natriegens]MCY9878540.1 basic amino acid/polyamine antiporter [Vibrio natriegens]